ncbi:MAG: hypothetical protein ABSG61_09250 [Gemmatimonadales bacterium]|jgi:lysophospholipase L1-like esterase
MLSRKLAIAALTLPLLAACKDLVSNETLGPAAVPSGGAMFATYVALGTSISAGVQSGGINDSTQKQAFPYRLATAMGLTPGVNWFYPSFPFPGCTPPFSNILTKTYVGGTASTCTLLNPAYARPYQNNLGIPSLKVGQALNILSLLVPATDTLKAASFVTGGRNPVAVMAAAQPTFVTVELGANDALHAATSGDTTQLTSLAVFQRQYDSLAAAVAATGANVALANVPNVSNIPYITRGYIFFCAHSGACGSAAAAPFSSTLFTVDLSCLPSSSGGVGDKMAVALPATATIAQVLAGGGAASLNCGAGTATVTTAAGTAPVGPIVTVAAMATITQRVIDINTKIASVATTHGWALANLDSVLSVLVAAGQIPPIPNLATPSNLFGTYVSLDGFHPSGAGSKLIADAFVAAINKKYGSALTPP